MKTSEVPLLQLSFLLCWELASPGPWELGSTNQRSRPALDEPALLNHPAPSGGRVYPSGSGFGRLRAVSVHPCLAGNCPAPWGSSQISSHLSLEQDLLPVPRYSSRTPTSTFPRSDFCPGRMFTFPSRLFLTFKQKCFLL